MAETMAARLPDGAAVEAVCHRERTGPLGEGTGTWQCHDALATLPERPLEGWEELVVFTANHVYRQVGVGYGGGVTVSPRTPEALASAAAAGDAASGARASDD